MAHKSRDDFRREKELEEARKAGLAPAATDADGKEINPHIPQYMTKGLWYLNQEGGHTLMHQRLQKDEKDKDKEWYDRGAKVFQATKYRKGACENCGSMSHKTKDCLERPRAKGAKFTGRHIAPDEKVEEIQIKDFEAKRDRWKGYDADEYAKVVERYEQVESLRKEIKRRELKEQKYGEGGEGRDEDEDKLDEAENVDFSKVEKRVRSEGGGATGSVRNLRIREDTAKYLLNLDLDSAYYDPKSRSMREDPTPHKPAHEKYYQGDNFLRLGGQEYQEFMQLQVHQAQAGDKGFDLTANAAPSQAEALFKEYKQRKEALTGKIKTNVSERYGSITEDVPEDVRALGATENYVEYDRAGRLIRGQERKKNVSRYPEDVFVNNHTSVWGSFWKEGQWGYACCHQFVRNCICTGGKGKELEARASELMNARTAEAEQRRAEAAAKPAEGFKGAALWGTETGEDVALDQAKLKEALRKQEEINRGEGGVGDRDRGYNSFKARETDVSAEEMEAFRMKRQRTDDPLAFMDPAGLGAAQGGHAYV